MLTLSPCNPTSRTPRRESRVQRVLVTFVVFVCVAAVPVFAGGSSRGEAQTFGAYQSDFHTGPVGITIRGNSNLQIVSISEQNIPPDVAVKYQMRGGILTVTASYTGKTKADPKPGSFGHLMVEMPRYEFVHVFTTSGPVSIDNLSTNHLSVQTGTGDIHVTNTNAALKAQSTTGDQSYQQIYGAIDADSTSGNMSVSHTWGVMNLKSHTGSFDGKNVNLAGNSTFTTYSGSINVGLTYGLARYRYYFNLRSKSGKITLGDIIRDGGTVRWGEGNVAIAATTDSGAESFR